MTGDRDDELSSGAGASGSRRVSNDSLMLVPEEVFDSLWAPSRFGSSAVASQRLQAPKRAAAAVAFTPTASACPALVPPASPCARWGPLPIPALAAGCQSSVTANGAPVISPAI